MYYYLLEKGLNSKDAIVNIGSTDKNNLVKTAFTNYVQTHDNALKLLNADIFAILEYDKPTDSNTIIEDYDNWNDNITEIIPTDCTPEMAEFESVYDFAYSIIKTAKDQTTKNIVRNKLIEKLVEISEYV